MGKKQHNATVMVPDLVWQQQARDPNRHVEAVRSYLLETKSNDMSAAMAAVRKYCADHNNQPNMIKVR